ncbi:hypothetical protein FM119_02505 [Mycetocola reblochoni REB411]|uniref:Phage protein n=1 Tax=Mycetocola reblochoni REB411 TaxID=1255698 RepID=A0A1R4ILX2_9MICO|nr:hypothetical protein FM119_02505 [Mycetocola reblochoni REB411]
MKLKTIKVQGVELRIDPGVLDDFRVVDLLDQIQFEPGKQTRAAGLLRLIVGEQFTDLLDALTDEETGRASTENAVQALMDIMKELAPNS